MSNKIMKKIKLLGLIPGIAMAFIAGPAIAEELPQVKLKVAQAMMSKTSLTHKLIEEMAANVTQRTDGKVTFTVLGPEVGDWAELERMTKRGAIDMQFNVFDTGLDPRWSFNALPFTVEGWEQARTVFGSHGVMAEIVSPWAVEKGLTYLGPWLNGISSFGLREEIVTNPELAKGLKIRVPPVATFKSYVEKMGFSAITIPWAETPTAVATGLVDGWVGSSSVYMYDLFRDVANVMVLTYESPEVWHMTFNAKKWEKLPEAYRIIIKEEANKINVKHLAAIEKEELDNQAKLKEMGWTIVDMAKDHPEELARWKSLAQETWDEYAPIVGQHNIDKLKAVVANKI
jgi:TRAP-type C4-dicarboxylate transport system substrate-binding protein